VYCNKVRLCYVSWTDSSDHLFAIDDTPFQFSLHSTFELRDALDSFDWNASMQTNSNIGHASEIDDALDCFDWGGFTPTSGEIGDGLDSFNWHATQVPLPEPTF
jgi:hypothetical protein